MDEHKILHVNNSSMLFTYIKITISFFLLTSTLPQFHCQPPPQPSDYSTCKGQPGDLFRFNCHRDQDTTILIGTQNFTVLDINTKDYTIKMKRTDLNHDVCSPQFDDIDLSPTLSRYDQSVGNITIFYNCSSKGIPPYFNCGPHGDAVGYAGAEDKLFEENPDLKRCKRHIHVPVPLGPYDYYHYGRGDLEGILNEGFEVKYTANEECVSCFGSAKRCWSDYIDRHLQSCCHEGSNATFCHKSTRAFDGAYIFGTDI